MDFYRRDKISDKKKKEISLQQKELLFLSLFRKLPVYPQQPIRKKDANSTIFTSKNKEKRSHRNKLWNVNEITPRKAINENLNMESHDKSKQRMKENSN